MQHEKDFFFKIQHNYPSRQPPYLNKKNTINPLISFTQVPSNETHTHEAKNSIISSNKDGKKKSKRKKKLYRKKPNEYKNIYKRFHSNNTQHLHQSTSQSKSALACIHVYFVYMHTCSNTNNLVRSTEGFALCTRKKFIYKIQQQNYPSRHPPYLNKKNTINPLISFTQMPSNKTHTRGENSKIPSNEDGRKTKKKKLPPKAE